jgi:hypothetical protein
MTWGSLNGLILVLAVSIMELAAVIMGYWMGRNSVGMSLSNQPKRFKPGPQPANDDPYAEALMPQNPIGKRIPTI